MTRRWLPVLALLAAGFLAAPARAEAVATVDGVRVMLETVVEDAGKPVFLTAPKGDPRLFIVDQDGLIRILDGGRLAETPFLDVQDLVATGGGEQGLLGLAFHPGYASNGRFFLNYTDTDGDTQVVEYRVSADPARADPASAKVILSVDQPYRNHNGGWIAFGPDGFLYVGMGDGGSGGDPQGNGQNPDALLAKILRIDVDGGDPYAIPPGNPFAGGGGAPEVFLTGLRNPWRNAFDGNDLYIADVGQNAYEEVHVVPLSKAGANLGWNIMEGTHCYRRRTCASAGLDKPVFEYSHDEGCSITGGYVYRGKALPALAGRYIFADYCAGILLSFRYAGGKAAAVAPFGRELGALSGITSFGVDDAGELYVLFADGVIRKLVSAP